MANIRTDQFDSFPENVDRVGAHRGPKVRGLGWITFLWAVLATAVLVVAGLYVLSFFNPSLKLGFGGANVAGVQPSSTPTPVITPISDPAAVTSRKITITVLNGTPTVGLQNTVATKLKTAGWAINGTANSTSTKIKTTTIYYENYSNMDVALGLQKLLGASAIQFSNAFPGSPITVVVGSDYKQ